MPSGAHRSTRDPAREALLLHRALPPVGAGTRAGPAERAVVLLPGKGTQAASAHAPRARPPSQGLTKDVVPVTGAWLRDTGSN